MYPNFSAIRSRAPLRIGLAGGGTDIPEFYQNYNGGCVINSSISLYSHCTILPVENSKKVIFTSLDKDASFTTHEQPTYVEPTGDLILHKAVFNRIVKDFQPGAPLSGIHVITSADVPTGSGLGGSSSAVVAMLSAYSVLLDLSLTQEDLAQLAYSIEREDLGYDGGKQDQYCAAYGGLNFLALAPTGVVTVEPLQIPLHAWLELEQSLILYYTGIHRRSDHIIKEQSNNIHNKVNKVPEYMNIIKQETFTMRDGLLNWDIDLIKQSIVNSWEAKKSSASTISNSSIDHLFNAALEAGAYGGKISGAGGGGFLMLLCDPIRKKSIINKLRSITGYELNFNLTSHGAIAWKINNNER